MIGSWYAYGACSDSYRLTYGPTFVRASLSVVGTALSGWLSHRHSKAALPVAIATAVGTLVSGAAHKHFTKHYVEPSWPEDSLREKVFNHTMPVVQAAEVAALVGVVAARQLRDRRDGIEAQPGPLSPAPWYPRARKLGLYFIGFSLVGHWVEILFCLGIKHGIFKGGYDRSNHMLWDQVLFPFSAEGTAAVLADLVLVPAKETIEGAANALAESSVLPSVLATPIATAASFLVNQIICTSVDYGTGMVANRNYELWDYRDMKYHFQGQVCLQNSLFYTTMATWGVWSVLPWLEELMAQAGDTVLDGTLVGATALYGFLALYHFIMTPDSAGSQAGA